MDNIKLVIPKKSEFISTIRLTSSALANIANFNIDDIEDIKVIISEICTFLINNIENSDKPLEINYCLDMGIIKVEVKDLNDGCLKKDSHLNNDMSILIIESLADKCEIDYENKILCFVKSLN